MVQCKVVLFFLVHLLVGIASGSVIMEGTSAGHREFALEPSSPPVRRRHHRRKLCGELLFKRDECQMRPNSNNRKLHIDWNDPKCQALVIVKHLEKVIEVEKHCTDYDVSLHPMCSKITRCYYELYFVSEEEDKGYLMDRIEIEDLRMVANRNDFLIFGEEQRSPRDIFGSAQLRELGGGKSGADKFFNEGTEIVFKSMDRGEYNVFTKDHDDKPALHEVFEARLESKQSFLPYIFGVQSIYRYMDSKSEEATLFRHWHVMQNLIPGGFVHTFYPPEAICDIKPQEMIGENYPNCRSLFGEMGPWAPFVTSHSEGKHALGDEDHTQINMKKLVSMKTDLDLLYKYELVDYSWLVFMARPRIEIENPNVYAPIATKLESGHFVFLGIIDPFVTYGLHRHIESVLKSFRAWTSISEADIQDNGEFSIRSPSPFQFHKFFEYAQKQFVLASVFFICVDARIAMDFWHNNIVRSLMHTPRHCGSGYPTHFPRTGDFHEEVGEKVEMFQ